MAVGENLSVSVQPGTTLTTIVDVQTAKKFIKSIALVNTTSSPAKVTLNLTRSGTSASMVNQIVSNFEVANNDTRVLENFATMMIGDKIEGLQVTSGAISVHVTLVEVA